MGMTKHRLLHSFISDAAIVAAAWDFFKFWANRWSSTAVIKHCCRLYFVLQQKMTARKKDSGRSLQCNRPKRNGKLLVNVWMPIPSVKSGQTMVSLQVASNLPTVDSRCLCCWCFFCIKIRFRWMLGESIVHDGRMPKELRHMPGTFKFLSKRTMATLRGHYWFFHFDWRRRECRMWRLSCPLFQMAKRWTLWD